MTLSCPPCPRCVSFPPIDDISRGERRSHGNSFFKCAKKNTGTKGSRTGFWAIDSVAHGQCADCACRAAKRPRNSRNKNIREIIMRTSSRKGSSGNHLPLSACLPVGRLVLQPGSGSFVISLPRSRRTPQRHRTSSGVAGNHRHRFEHCTKARLILLAGHPIELGGDCQDRLYLRDRSSSEFARHAELRHLRRVR